MTDWNPGQYLQFEDERTRPAIDLVSRVPIVRADRCVDLGCGPGNSTALLVQRFPDALVTGIDSSPAMIAKARERLPAVRFDVADLSTWSPGERVDLIFANAVFQWVPDHARLVRRLAGFLRPGGCLAVQVPDNEDEPSHRVMLDVAQGGLWAGKLSAAVAAREPIASIDAYYGWLLAAGCTVDIWRTIYVHPLEGAAAIVEWFTSTGLKPFLDALAPHERPAFVARYEAGMVKSYPAREDGKVLLQFPRLFFVAQRAADATSAGPS